MLSWFRKDERGAVTVVAALVMVVLLGSAGLAVDYGAMVNEKSALQNACDAAVLAGVVESGVTQQESKARDYLLANTGGSISDVSFIQSGGDTLEMKVSKEVSVYFSQVLTGNNTQTISAQAAAKRPASSSYLSGNAVIAQEVTIPNKSTTTVINGNVVVEDDEINYGNNNATLTVINGEIQMERDVADDFAHLKEIADSKSWIRVDMDKIDQSDIDSGMFQPGGFYEFTGDVQFKNDVQNVNFNIKARGDIKFVGNTNQASNGVLIYSETGSIEFTGGDLAASAVMFAPNGTVYSDANKDFEVSGCVIAKEFETPGNADTDIVYNEDAFNEFFGQRKPKLVK